MTRILVTRPEPHATRTSQRLISLGYESVNLPLTKIVPLDTPPYTKPVTHIIATSSHAFLSLPPFEKNTPVLVVGQKTQVAAQNAGFHTVHMIGKNIADLIQNLPQYVTETSHILYCCGVVRHPHLEAFLTYNAYSYHCLEVYDTHIISYPSHALTLPVDGVIVTSTLSVTVLHHLPFTQMFENAMFFCFSERIAQMLNYSHYRICQTPDETSLITSVNGYFNV